jgi:hypothetical protein
MQAAAKRLSVIAFLLRVVGGILGLAASENDRVDIRIGNRAGIVFPGSARASRARFGALAETPLPAVRNEFGNLKSSRSRGRDRQHARRVRSPE